MFTGLVDHVGRIRELRLRGRGARLSVEHDWREEPPAPGESIAVDGCCLTAVAPTATVFEADLSAETLTRTGGPRRWRPGRPVNLERSLRAGDRLGGHLVLGHADGLARLIAVRRTPGDVRMRLATPREGQGLVAGKGSVALDGVSLTVAATGPGWFEVALIPETLSRTTLAARRPGDLLVIEFDVLARYARQATDAARG
ncbi:MAG: riboflavin synthase [Acidobacteriota bacterium]